MTVLDEQLVPARPNRRLCDAVPLEQPPGMRAPWSALVLVGCVVAGAVLAVASWVLR